MKTTACVATLVAAIGAFVAGASVPADARHHWNSGWGGNSGWNSSQSIGSNFGSGGSGSGCSGHHHHSWNNNGSSLGYNGNYYNNGGLSGNGLGFGSGAFGGGSNGLFSQDARLSTRIQSIQNRLNAGNLTAAQQSALQNRLSMLQSQQTNLNGYLTNNNTSQQGYIQNLLNSGTLNPNQAAYYQNQLSQLQSQQTALGNPSLLSSFGNFFRRF